MSLQILLFAKPGLKKMSIWNGRLMHVVTSCLLATEYVTTQARWEHYQIQYSATYVRLSSSTTHLWRRREGEDIQLLLIHDLRTRWGWVARVTLRQLFDPRRGQRVFPLTSVSRPALRPTHPPVQWVTGVLSPGVKARPGRDADHSLPFSAEVENE
jgi:hypothetical protein